MSVNWRTVAISSAISLLVGAGGIALAAQTNFLGVVFIADPTVTSRQLAVNADGSINTTQDSGSSVAPIVSTTTESGHVLKVSAGDLIDAYVTTGGTAGFFLVFASATVPGDGAVTPQHCVTAPANATTSIYTSGSPPETFATGISVAFSTTGCFTKTASATAYFHARVQ